MHLIRWAAVLTSGLLGLYILFGVVEMDTTAGSRLIRVLLGLMGIAAAFGLHRAERWGKPAVIGYGVLLFVIGALSITRGQDDQATVITMIPGLVVALLGAFSDTQGALPPWRGTPPEKVGRPTEGGVSDASVNR